MSDLNPYEASLAIDLARAQARTEALERERVLDAKLLADTQALLNKVEVVMREAADRIQQLEREVERRIEPEQVEKLIEMAEPVMAELYAAACADAKEAEARVAELEAALALARAALDEAIYLLDPDEEDITKETGLFRIVTARAALAASERKE